MGYVNQILYVWENARPHNVEAGANWYSTARQYAEKVAAIAECSLPCAVSVLSALSPRNRWERNVQDAYTVAAAFRAGGPYNIKSGTFNSNVEKAFKVLFTGNPQLPGEKVQAFADNILDPYSLRVTIDVWAVRVANLAPDLNVARFDYPTYEAAYVKAAERVGILPKHLQATTWLEMRGRVAQRVPMGQLALFN